MNRDRIISSTLMIILTVVGILNKWIFMVVLLAIVNGGLYEFFYLLKKKGIPIYSYTGIIIGVLIQISTFMKFQPTKKWELLFFVILLLAVFLMQFTRKDNTNAIVGISTTLFGVLYVAWFSSFFIKVRFMLPGWEGVRLLGFILLITKVGDMGALIIGSKYGKHPLLKRVSPNKTIEGCMGSFGGSVLASVLGSCLLPTELNFPLWHVALMGFVFGGIGQIGDLSESLLKRDFNVKDSGKMLPALGGVLDAIDSLLFSVPVFYFYISHVFESMNYAM